MKIRVDKPLNNKHSIATENLVLFKQMCDLLAADDAFDVKAEFLDAHVVLSDAVFLQRIELFTSAPWNTPRVRGKVEVGEESREGWLTVSTRMPAVLTQAEDPRFGENVHL